MCLLETSSSPFYIQRYYRCALHFQNFFIMFQVSVTCSLLFHSKFIELLYIGTSKFSIRIKFRVKVWRSRYCIWSNLLTLFLVMKLGEITFRFYGLKKGVYVCRSYLFMF